MKAIVAALLVIGGTGIALADAPGPDWMSRDQVIAKLQSMGYSDIRKLEADDGHWEGDATKGGRAYEIHVDPHSGALTKNEPKTDD